MKHKNILSLLFVAILITLTGCSSTNKESTSKETSSIEYQTITAKEAKKMMDQDSSVIVLDVRTEEEFNTGHIDGSLLIPYTEITEMAEGSLSDKSATILVYCRSGRRSSIAAQALVDLGYTNIYDFGGINDWSYDIVTN